MEAMREQWTDARLDDFKAETAQRFNALDRRIDNGFNRIEASLRELRQEMKAEFKNVDEGFAKVDERFEKVDERFDAMYRLTIQVGGVIVAALIGLLATQV